MKYDVIIIGSGVTGSAVARELAKTDLKVAVLEKEEDVCEGTSKANSGICHAGFDARPGTLKARLNVEGNRLIRELAGPLSIDFRQTGSMVLCFDEEHRGKVEELLERGKANGVKGLEILEKDEVLARAPHVNENVVCALWAPTAGIVCPFSLNFALAENAADNGVEFFFDEPVKTIEKDGADWLVNGKSRAKVLVNAAGLYADEIHNMVCPDHPIRIRPRRGEYFLFDHDAAGLADCVLFQLPTALGKGVLITPTCHGNLLVGPTAENLEDKEALNTSARGLEEIRTKAALTIRDLPYHQVITSFAGLRAVPENGDFIIQESADGFFDAAGIESPGLTSAPAIGVLIADWIEKKLQPGKNEHFIETRKGFVKLDELSAQEWNDLIREDPDYGTIVCRCETISAGQIKDACTRSVPARSLDGVKRRVRAGMGRCQAGFCSPRTMEILAEMQNIPLENVQKSGSGSRIFTGKDKEGAAYE